MIIDILRAAARHADKLISQPDEPSISIVIFDDGVMLHSRLGSRENRTTFGWSLLMSGPEQLLVCEIDLIRKKMKSSPSVAVR